MSPPAKLVRQSAVIEMDAPVRSSLMLLADAAPVVDKVENEVDEVGDAGPIVTAGSNASGDLASLDCNQPWVFLILICTTLCIIMCIILCINLCYITVQLIQEIRAFQTADDTVSAN